MTNEEITLPLPEPALREPWGDGTLAWFSAGQMTEYAKAYAAVLIDRQQRAERDALLADASRYRYLRNRNPNEVLTSRGPAAGLWIDCENSAGTLIFVYGEDADYDIDEALAKEPK